MTHLQAEELAEQLGAATRALVVELARSKRLRRVLEAIIGEASAFIEFDPYTNDAFIRIGGLAKDAL